MVRIQKLIAKKINGIPLEEDALLRSNFSCETKPPKKSVKSLSFDSHQNWDDSFIKEILNEPMIQNEHQVNVKYFPDTNYIDGNMNFTRIIIKNPVKLSGTEIDLENFTDRFWMKNQDQVSTTSRRGGGRDENKIKLS